MSSNQFNAGQNYGQAQEKAGQFAGQAQEKASNVAGQAKDQASHAQQDPSGFLQQTGEQMKNMAQGAIDGVKNTLGAGESNK